MLPREPAPKQTRVSKTRGKAGAGAAEDVAAALGHGLGPWSPLPRERNTQPRGTSPTTAPCLLASSSHPGR